jgi:hypothetical protein
VHAVARKDERIRLWISPAAAAASVVMTTGVRIRRMSLDAVGWLLGHFELCAKPG